jgi:hypothetical protein
MLPFNDDDYTDLLFCTHSFLYLLWCFLWNYSLYKKGEKESQVSLIWISCPLG